MTFNLFSYKLTTATAPEKFILNMHIASVCCPYMEIKNSFVEFLIVSEQQNVLIADSDESSLLD